MTIKKRIKHWIKWLGRTKAVIWLIGELAFIYSWLVGKTGKFELYDQQQAFEKLMDDNNGGIFVAWHGRALMLPFFWRNTRPMKALVSPHNDGRIIAQLLKNYNIMTIDGSSDRQASKAALDIVKELNQGTIVSLISDGPRGPRMRLNKSVIYFAQKTGKPIVGYTYSSENALVLTKAWDAMLLPKLFKKAVVLGTKPMFVPADASEEEMERLRKQFEDELNALTYEVDKRCGVQQVLPEDTVRAKRHLHRHRH
ncbi:MAG: lysophospholipid acyltransferase family protein [Alphaproteobacteria bacterium]|nr:lysophospholipid acyltransferase family protein [Alphaproteobacteria bacterium]